jgi:hypothetical protein
MDTNPKDKKKRGYTLMKPAWLVHLAYHARKQKSEFRAEVGVKAKTLYLNPTDLLILKILFLRILWIKIWTGLSISEDAKCPRKEFRLES